MDPVQLGHHNVDQQQMDLLFFEHLDRLLPVICLIDRITFLKQINLDRIHDLPIIITNQNISHVILPAYRMDHNVCYNLIKKT